MLRYISYFPYCIIFAATICGAVIDINTVAVRKINLGQVIKEPGHFICGKSQCLINLAYSDMGGFLVLKIEDTLKKEVVQVINDVTGVAWASDSLLVYSTSPIYGKPGLHVYNCEIKKLTTIVKAKNIDTAYPVGSDYFELYSLTTGNKAKIYFYYAPDVDSIDFDKFREPSSLFQVGIDGGGFEKTIP